MAFTFRTVPDELVFCAETTAAYYRERGYSVRPERSELGYPNTPTLQAKRDNTIVVVEVLTRVVVGDIKRWIGYGKSSGRDFRLVVCLDSHTALNSRSERELRELGVGCLVLDGTTLTERLVAADLGLNVELPSLDKMSIRIRRALGPAYEQFDRRSWREGFSDACQAFEGEARRYLKRHSKSGRIEVLRKSGPAKLTPKQINKMTMGTLRDAFRGIVAQNQADSTIADVLASVNKDRIGVAHKKASKGVEARLRKNVGRHMWTLYAGFQVVFD